jgi:hypothetical protein
MLLHAAIGIHAMAAGVSGSIAPSWLCNNTYLHDADKTIVGLNSITSLVSNVAAVVILPLVGLMCQHAGKRCVMVTGIGVGTVHAGLFLSCNSSVSHLAVYYSASLVQSWVSAFNIAASQMAHSLRHIAILTYVYSIGTTIGCLAVTNLDQQSSLKVALCANAIAAILVLCDPTTCHDDGASTHYQLILPVHRRDDKKEWCIGCVTFLTSFVFSGLYCVLPQYLVTYFQFAPRDQSMLNIATTIGGMISKSVLVTYTIKAQSRIQNLVCFGGVGLLISCVTPVICSSKGQVIAGMFVGSVSALIWPCLTTLSKMQNAASSNAGNWNVRFGKYEGVSYVGAGAGSVVSSIVYAHHPGAMWIMLSGVQALGMQTLLFLCLM